MQRKTKMNGGSNYIFSRYIFTFENLYINNVFKNKMVFHKQLHYRAGNISHVTFTIAISNDSIHRLSKII